MKYLFLALLFFSMAVSAKASNCQAFFSAPVVQFVQQAPVYQSPVQSFAFASQPVFVPQLAFVSHNVQRFAFVEQFRLANRQRRGLLGRAFRGSSRLVAAPFRQRCR